VKSIVCDRPRSGGVLRRSGRQFTILVVSFPMALRVP